MVVDSSTSHRVGFTWIVLDIAVIILYKLQSSLLPHIKLLVSEEILQTLMVSEDRVLLSEKNASNSYTIDANSKSWVG